MATVSNIDYEILLLLIISHLGNVQPAHSELLETLLTAARMCITRQWEVNRFPSVKDWLQKKSSLLWR